MPFLLSFLQFLQPGILFPEIAEYRPMIVASALALLLGLVTRPSVARVVPFTRPAFVYMVLFILVQGLSVYYGGVRAMVEKLAWWYVYPVFVYLSVLLIWTAKDLRRFVWGMILGGVFIVLYGMAMVYSLRGIDPANRSELPEELWHYEDGVLVAHSAVFGRAAAYGMYENHNDYTFLIILIVPFIYLMMRRSPRFLTRLLLLVFLATCILGVFMSLSRGGMLALVLEIGLLAWYTTRVRLAWLLVLGLLGSVAIQYQFDKRDMDSDGTYTAKEAKENRYELWRAGARMFKSHPFLGVGSQRFGEFSSDYGEISYDNWRKNSHNTYVEVISTTGLFGFLTFLLFLKNMAWEFRQPAPLGAEDLETLRLAGLVSLYSLMFRALLDAKTHEWGFYMLCAVAVAYGALRVRAEEAELELEEEEEAEAEVRVTPA